MSDRQSLVKDDAVNTEDTTENVSVVRVAQMPGQTVHVQYVAGMTLNQAIDSSGYEIGRGQQVTVNGVNAANLDATVNPDDVVVIVGKTNNG